MELDDLDPERAQQAQHASAGAVAFPTFSSETDDTAWISDDSEMQTPQFVAAHDAHGVDASDDEVEVPSPAVHRDSHASFVWAPAPRGPDALNQWMDRSSRKPDFSALVSSSSTVLKQTLQHSTAFALAPASKPAQAPLQLLPADVDVPLKDASVFAYADPTFPSTRGHRPELIMATLKRALALFDAIEVRETPWRFDIACLCVAELVAFTVQLARLGDDGSVSDRTSFEVSFHRTTGDETRFLALVDCIRARCSAIDDDALPILDDTLEPWMDARQAIESPRAVLEPKDALELLKQLRADLHAKTRFEVAKSLKDHCRHARNRTTFYRVDPKHFLLCLQDLVASPSLELSRLGVFILLQFATDAPSDATTGRTRRAPFFHSPYEKRTFALQLADVMRAHSDAPCGAFVRAMVQRVQQSWLFA